MLNNLMFLKDRINDSLVQKKYDKSVSDVISYVEELDKETL